MKILNLDDIVLDSQRTVRYKGNEYAVRDFNMTEFIAFQKHFNDFQLAFNSTEQEDMNKLVASTIELTKLGVPEFPIEEVKLLNPVQLMALVSMIANLIPTGDDEKTAEAQAGDGKKEIAESQEA
jgi:hypothetical protein